MSEDLQKKQEEFFQKARLGVLKFLMDQGGTLNMGDLHDYSFKKYFIQHQGFSRLMESLVNEGLVTYDALTQDTTISDFGKKAIAG